MIESYRRKVFYWYIGITSLCLYNTGHKGLLQDGVLYKSHDLHLYITQILYISLNIYLTSHSQFDMINMLGPVHKDRPLVYYSGTIRGR